MKEQERDGIIRNAIKEKLNDQYNAAKAGGVQQLQVLEAFYAKEKEEQEAQMAEEEA